MEHMQVFVAGFPLVVAGSLASLIAGLAAGVGALPILMISVTSRRIQDMLLGCAAGIMLGATCFSLVLPAIDLAHDHVNGSLPAGLVVATGICLGAVGLALLHRMIPHEHAFAGREGLATDLEIRRIWLFVLAITLHNFPEGLAVGIGFGAENIENSMAITIAIFLQNLPEGFVVALAVLPLGYSRWTVILVALATGAVETVGGLVGTVVVSPRPLCCRGHWPLPVAPYCL